MTKSSVLWNHVSCVGSGRIHASRAYEAQQRQTLLPMRRDPFVVDCCQGPILGMQGHRGCVEWLSASRRSAHASLLVADRDSNCVHSDTTGSYYWLQLSAHSAKILVVSYSIASPGGGWCSGEASASCHRPCQPRFIFGCPELPSWGVALSGGTRRPIHPQVPVSKPTGSWRRCTRVETASHRDSWDF